MHQRAYSSRLKILYTGILLLAISGCSKTLVFQKQTYRAVDDKEVITLNSTDELELSAAGNNYVCKYSIDNGSLRVVLNVAGSMQAVYYDVVPQGLREKSGVILYEPKQYQTVMGQIIAQRRQAEVDSALTNAVQINDATSTIHALEQGAQIELRDSNGLTPLMRAAFGNSADVIKVLLEHKANANARTPHGETALIIAVDSGRNMFANNRNIPMYDSRAKNDLYNSVRLLGSKDVIDAQNSMGWTALMSAAQQGKSDIVKLLVQSGANRDLRSSENKRAADYNTSDEVQSALRTEDESKRFNEERTDTKTIGTYREEHTYAHQKKPRDSILTDVKYISSYVGDANTEYLFLDIVGEPWFDDDSFGHFNVMIKTKNNDSNQIAFGEKQTRDKLLQDMKNAIRAWRAKYQSGTVSNAFESKPAPLASSDQPSVIPVPNVTFHAPNPINDVPVPNSGEHYPDTHLRRMSNEEVVRMSPAAIRYAINEMYARHGADFRDREIKANFQRFAWYNPVPGKSYDAVETEFTDVERDNLKLLGVYRDTQKKDVPANSTSVSTSFPRRRTQQKSAERSGNTIDDRTHSLDNL